VAHAPKHAKTPLAGTALLTALALTGGPGAAAIPFPPAPPSIIQFAANPPQPEAGQRTTLTWTISGGAPSALVLDPMSGGPALDLTGRAALDGIRAVGRQTLTLKAGNPWGASQASLTLVARGLHLVAGDVSGPGNGDGFGPRASFRMPSGLALDGGGDLLVADALNATVRRIAPDGKVTTLAGVPGRPGWEDGPAATARFNEPGGVAVDPGTGCIYVADTGNSVLRRLDPDGTVSTLAGAPGQGGLQDGTGAAARFSHPQGLAILADGGLVVADTGNSAIRRVSPDGTVTTLAGAPGSWGYEDGPAASAQFGSPWAVAVDAAQNVFVADTFNNAIRRIAGGQVTTLAGACNEEGLVDGTLDEARFRWPMALAVAEDGTLIIADSGNGVVRTLAAGRVETLAATGGGLMKDPQGLALDARGTLFVADTGNSVIRRLDPGGPLVPFAGAMAAAGAGDAQGAKARFDHPGKIVVDPATGDALVADSGNGLVRRITADGRVRTLEPGGALTGLQGLTALALDSAGDLYAVQPRWGKVLRIPPHGPATAAATWDEQGGPGAAPPAQDLVVDAQGSIFLTDPCGSAVRRILKDGTVTVFAGRPGEAGIDDGSAERARFLDPTGLALDLEENLIVTDQCAHTVRRISRLGRVTTLAGTPGEAGSRDGDGAHAQFNGPQGVAVDAQGNIFVADTGNFTIRRISPDGQVTTVAGVPGRAGALMGPLPGSLAAPTSVAVTRAGDLLVLCGNGIVQITDP